MYNHLFLQKDPEKEYKTAENHGIQIEFVNTVYDSLMKVVSTTIALMCMLHIVYYVCLIFTAVPPHVLRFYLAHFRKELEY